MDDGAVERFDFVFVHESLIVRSKARVMSIVPGGLKPAKRHPIMHTQLFNVFYFEKPIFLSLTIDGAPSIFVAAEAEMFEWLTT